MKARRILPSLLPATLVPVFGALIVAGLACSGAPQPDDSGIRDPKEQDAKPGKSDTLPSWPMLGGTPGRNMANAVDKNLPSEWSAQKNAHKNIKWVAKLGSYAYGGPAIAGGRVFVGTNNDNPRDPKIKGDKGVLMCFRESDGEFLWQSVHDKLPNPMANDWPQQGIASTPAVDGDRLYYVSNRCELVCADVAGDADKKTAKIIWRLDMMQDLGVYPNSLANCSPLVAGDLVFAVTGNGRDSDQGLPAPKAPSFIAVDTKTGKLKWKSSLPGEQIIAGQWSNPAYGVIAGKPQVIFPGGDGWLYAFEPDKGELIWKFDCNLKSATIKDRTRSYILATPVIHDNKVYVGVGTAPEIGYESKVGHFWCIDATKTGDISPVNDNLDPKAAVNKKSGLVWHYGGEVVPKPNDGREIHFNRTLSTAAIHDGLVYVADIDSFVYCLDAKTGKKYWDYDLLSEIWGSPYYVDGKVFVGAGNGEVSVFTHGKTPPKKDGFPVNSMAGSIKTPVVAVNGTLYVMTSTHLYAIVKK